MASVDSEFVMLVSELLAPLGHIRPRRMFGAVGLYCDGAFFAIISDDVLYLKGDAQTKDRFDAMEMQPFAVPSGRPVTLSYFEVPGEWLDNEEQILEFATLALGAARRSQAQKGRTAKT
ncbi:MULTISPECIES: TfoX/Sxy family protein [unclassified Thalassospira]|uniref:TfoX/Sxy family protein n=1 Tax=unclassified Thalassospira TaxID=2648997 RepID=UPI0018CD9F67|nr:MULTISPECIES: TfoX/Sxy family protein [unclassified Thalassospira]QPO10666.1 TfoX/Sxy family protein [Thalassospira sp. A40-3]|tara:strand:+ start:216 stop:572 length:357 start_codon:yes stop_codon:yes gene_type:complete